MTGFRPFVYGLYDPQDAGHIRYVGMAPVKASRPLCHSREARRKSTPLSYKINWIRKLHAEGRDYGILILEELFEDTQREFVGEVEKMYIKSLREIGHKLTNATDGGEGCSNPSAENLEKRAVKLRGNKFRLGHKHSGVTRKRMSDSRRKYLEDNPPVPIADGTKVQIAKTLTGYKHTDKARANMAASRVGSKRSLEARQNMSRAQKGRTVSLESRKQIADSLTGRKDSVETRLLKRESAIKAKASFEARENARIKQKAVWAVRKEAEALLTPQEKLERKIRSAEQRLAKLREEGEK